MRHYASGIRNFQNKSQRDDAEKSRIDDYVRTVTQSSGKMLEDVTDLKRLLSEWSPKRFQVADVYLETIAQWFDSKAEQLTEEELSPQWVTHGYKF